MLTAEWDWEKAERILREDCIKEGMQKGIKEGKKEGIIETAKMMLQNGIDLLTVSKCTNLDNETVMELANAR